MDGLNSLLARYRQLFADKQSEYGEILGVVKKQTGLKLSVGEIKLKEGVLFLKTKPKYKLEIILKKQNILDLFKEKGIKIVDLR
ncbi:MAG: hypothetical protein WC385_02020 [Candidatus Paceibacterota bacterium]|jgi:hypothetical protein